MVGGRSKLTHHSIHFRLIILFALFNLQSLWALSLADGALMLGAEVDLGMDATYFNENNKENLPGDTAEEQDQYIDENSLLGICNIKGTAVITAFPFLLDFSGGLDCWNMDFIIDRAYINLLGDSLSFSLGKQELLWGNGVLYFPLYFPDLLNSSTGIQSKNFDIPAHWSTDLRFDSAIQQLTIRGIIEESAVEAFGVPQWFFVQVYEQFYFSSLTISWQVAYERQIEEEENILIPGIDLSYIFENNTTLFGSFSGDISLDEESFEPRGSIGISWLLGNSFLSLEASYDEWFELGFFGSYALADTPFNASLTLKGDPIGLGILGAAALSYSKGDIDLEIGGVYMNGTETSYYGHSPVTGKFFVKTTISI
jgi:hypothetical protein